MKAFRTTCAAFIAAVGLCLCYAFCYEPMICNQLVRRLRARSMAAIAASDYRAPILARSILKDVKRCNDRCVPSTDIAMIKAVSEQLIGQPTAAVRTYNRALLYAKRPELYLSLGLALAKDNRPQEALTALTTAVEFAPSYRDAIADVELKARVEEAVRSRDRRHRGTVP